MVRNRTAAPLARQLCAVGLAIGMSMSACPADAQTVAPPVASSDPLSEPAPDAQKVPADPAIQPDEPKPAFPPAATVPAPALAQSARPSVAADEQQPDIIIRGRKAVPGDPLGAVNEKSFALTASVDNAVGGPAARAFKRVVPAPVRSGIRNFFSNLHEPVIFINFVLQHKFGKAAETLGRFTINTTIGGAGLFDVAKRRPFKLPFRPNGFADTLGFYGVKPGPFFYMPLLGPTTVRDLVGGFFDRAIMPLPLGKTFTDPVFRTATGVVRGLDHRAEIDDRIRTLRNSPENNYDAAREFYLKRRQAEVDALRGKRPPSATVPVPEPAAMAPLAVAPATAVGPAPVPPVD